MRAIVFLIAVSAWCQVTSIPALVNPSGGAIGGASAVATGQVLYGTGAGVAGSEAAFAYNASTNLLSIGAGTTVETVSVGRYSGGSFAALYLGIAPGSESLTNYSIASNGSSFFVNGPLTSSNIQFLQGNTERMRVQGTTGNVTLGTTVDGNFRLDIGSSGSAGTLRAYDQTATTGVTQLVVRAGAGQGSTNLTTWQNSGGTALAWVDSAGSYATNTNVDVGAVVNVRAGGATQTPRIILDAISNVVNLSSAVVQRWSINTTANSGTYDLGFARNAAGILEVNNGTAGTFRDLRIRDLITTLATPASSTATCTAGTYEADADYIYICTATNNWRRVALTSF